MKNISPDFAPRISMKRLRLLMEHGSDILVNPLPSSSILDPCAVFIDDDGQIHKDSKKIRETIKTIYDKQQWLRKTFSIKN